LAVACVYAYNVVGVRLIKMWINILIGTFSFVTFLKIDQIFLSIAHFVA
jgi:hypothetical protein